MPPFFPLLLSSFLFLSFLERERCGEREGERENGGGERLKRETERESECVWAVFFPVFHLPCKREKRERRSAFPEGQGKSKKRRDAERERDRREKERERQQGVVFLLLYFVFFCFWFTQRFYINSFSLNLSPPPPCVLLLALSSTKKEERTKEREREKKTSFGGAKKKKRC